MKNIKKCFNYTLFLCVFLMASCASAIAQIPKDERMNSGLNIYATFVDNRAPSVTDQSVVDVIEVKVVNDGDYRVRTDVVCERQGDRQKTILTAESYTISYLYFGFNRAVLRDSVDCRLENTELLEWIPSF